MAELWAYRTDYVRADQAKAREILFSDFARYKAAAEKRMAAFDKLPKAVRLEIHETGQLKAALTCKSRKGVDKIAAVRRASELVRDKTAIQL